VYNRKLNRLFTVGMTLAVLAGAACAPAQDSPAGAVYDTEEIAFSDMDLTVHQSVKIGDNSSVLVVVKDTAEDTTCYVVVNSRWNNVAAGISCIRGEVPDET
jgi:hypothetical protein